MVQKVDWDEFDDEPKEATLNEWMEAILALFADDRNLITYRPKLNKLTGGVTATILLSQIVYWWRRCGCRPFYKFNESCQHPAYRKGDSWREELGFTKREFETARRQIAQKVTKGVSKEEALKSNVVVFWTDADRKTWYVVNESLLAKRLRQTYGQSSS